MRFVKNIIVPESEEDEILLENGRNNKKKKLYGIYILSILVEESSYENPLKVKDLCIRVLERYKVLIDISTIQEYMKVFENFEGYQIRKNKDFSYYVTQEKGIYLNENNRLDDYQINYLIGVVSNSRKLFKYQKYEIIEKLSLLYHKKVNQEFVSDKNLIISQNEKDDFGVYTKLLEDIPRVITNNLVMNIKYRKNGVDSKYRRFYLYAFIPKMDGMLLIGCSKPGGYLRVITSSMIEYYNILENENFEKVPIQLKPSIFLSKGDIKYLEDNYGESFIACSEGEFKWLSKKLQKEKEKRGIK